MADSTVSGTSQTSGSTDAQSSYATKNKSLEDLGVSDFIKLLVSELQNQDPMQPMSNSEMLQQVSQIKSIQSNDKLTTTLDSVALGQSISNASSLLQRKIEGLTDAGDQVTGSVDRVTIENGVATLHVGKQTVSLKNVATILPNGTT
jgi:flagellar basal-body rod modification protein FlgD